MRKILSKNVKEIHRGNNHGDQLCEVALRPGLPQGHLPCGHRESWVQTTEWEQKSRLCFSARWKAENETQSQILWKVTFQKAHLTAKRSRQETCFVQRLGRKVGFLRIYDHSPTIMRVSRCRHSLPAWPRKPQITKSIWSRIGCILERLEVAKTILSGRMSPQPGPRRAPTGKDQWNLSS